MQISKAEVYQVFLTRQVEKQRKKLGKDFEQKFSKIIDVLRSNPYSPPVERLSGELRFIYSYHFNFSGAAYRLCFTVDEEKKIITVIMVGPRENFYKILKQKLF